ncbi:hypothetical protein [Kribbella catacumbae]|nr:hypothetical protein [Kribbella catacumbae]
MNSDWREGHEPVDHKQRHEAARLIAQAKSLIDQAKNAVRQSAGG